MDSKERRELWANPNKSNTREKDKLKKAVAIKYDDTMVAPKVVASGQGQIAERIEELGKENKVQVIQDEKLVNELSRVDIGDNIPPDLYEVVAQLLVFIGDLDKYYKK